MLDRLTQYGLPAIACGLLVFASWGYAQWAMDVTPWAFYVVPVIVLLAVLLFAVSLVGQRLGAEQMQDLRATLESLISPQA